MAIPDGFWTANLEATKDRMNQNLIQFEVAASRPAAGTKGLLFYATDTSQLSYDDGAAWQDIQGGLTEATKSDMEDEGATNADRAVSPEVAKFAPSATKVWVKWEQAGAHSIKASYNMTSVTDGGGAGDTDHLWNVDFSGGEYTVTGAGEDTGSEIIIPGVIAQATTGATTISRNSDDSVARDSNHQHLAAFGDQ